MTTTYSKAFKGIRMPSAFQRQRCGHSFRTTNCSVCPICRTDVARKIARAKAPPKPKTAPDFSLAAMGLELAGDSDFALAAWAPWGWSWRAIRTLPWLHGRESTPGGY